MNLSQRCFGSSIEISGKSYSICKANNGDNNAISLRNTQNGKFLRHAYGIIKESPAEKMDVFFVQDSSFVPRLYKTGVIFQCVNNGLEHLFICKTDEQFQIGEIAHACCFSIFRRLSVGELILLKGNSYTLCMSNNGRADCFSLAKHSHERQDYKRSFLKKERNVLFLRHTFGKVMESISDKNEATFADDSSFFICLEQGNYILKCSNPGLEDNYVLDNGNGELSIGKEGTKASLVVSNAAPYTDMELMLANQILILDKLHVIHDSINFETKKLNTTMNNVSEHGDMIYQSIRHNVLDKFAQSISPIYISVIVPVFNMSEYIEETINSITCQTLQHIEIIVIDDGSTDNSRDIVRRLASKDKRIKLFHQQNKGVGEARNLGIANSSGEFICFIDSDDLYPEEVILEKLYVYCKHFGASIAGGEFSLFSNDNHHYVQDFSFAYDGYLFDRTEILKYSDYQFDYGFHRFIYSKQMLLDNNLKFPSYKRFQDPPFMVKAMHAAKKFLAMDMISYGYRVCHKKIVWTECKINDFIMGISDNVQFALNNKYEKLQMYSFYHLADHLRQISNSCTADNKKKLIELFGMFDRDILERLSIGEKVDDVANMIRNIPGYN